MMKCTICGLRIYKTSSIFDILCSFCWEWWKNHSFPNPNPDKIARFVQHVAKGG